MKSVAKSGLLLCALNIEERTSRRSSATSFSGVQGYHFENDAFGNIIFGLESVPLEWFLTEYGAEISELRRMTGSPGSWAKNLASAPEYLRDEGIKAFILSSSLGLSGWVLAKEISISSTAEQEPATV